MNGLLMDLFSVATLGFVILQVVEAVDSAKHDVDKLPINIVLITVGSLIVCFTFTGGVIWSIVGFALSIVWHHPIGVLMTVLAVGVVYFYERYSQRRRMMRYTKGE